MLCCGVVFLCCVCVCVCVCPSSPLLPFPGQPAFADCERAGRSGAVGCWFHNSGEEDTGGLSHMVTSNGDEVTRALLAKSGRKSSWSEESPVRSCPFYRLLRLASAWSRSDLYFYLPTFIWSQRFKCSKTYACHGHP